MAQTGCQRAVTVGRALCALALACAAAPATSDATTISYPDFSNVAGLQLNGTARQSDTTLQLTAAPGMGAPFDAASAYSINRVSTTQSFSTAFELTMTNGSPEPADGMAFVLQSVGSTALGGPGGALGYGGVSPSLAVEFDIFNGNPGDPGAVDSGADDPLDQHVAITMNGDVETHLSCATLKSPPDPPCAATLPSAIYGQLVVVWIDYSAESHRLSVYVADNPTKPTRPTLTSPINLAARLGPSTFVGFSAATGMTFAQQDVLAWGLATVAPQARPDSDRDGIPDSADRCPTRARGRYDHDRDGCPGPYGRIKAEISGTWTIPRHGVRIESLAVRDVPAGAQIRLACRRCHVSERRRAPGKRGLKTVRLRRLVHRILPSGRSFTITVTAPGYIGLVLRSKVRPHGASTPERLSVSKEPFRSTTSCIPAGSRHSAKHCPSSPPG